MSSASAFLGPHRVRTLTDGPFERKQLRLAGSVDLADDPIAGEAVATVSAERVWHALLDFDFAAQATQTLGSDTTYTIGGIDWVKENSANDYLPAELVNGTGLIFCPNADLYAYETSHTGPRLVVPVADLVTGVGMLAGTVPMRASVRGYVAGVVAVNASEIYVGLHASADSLAYGSQYFNTTTQTCGCAKLRHAGALETVMSTVSVWPEADCTCIWFPNGIGGMGLRAGRGVWSDGWPEFAFLAGWDPGNEMWATSDWPEAGTWGGWNLAVGWKSQSNGPAYQGIIQNVRLEAYF
jgi:hypothetical protein